MKTLLRSRRHALASSVRQGGFTLVELVIVITIIGILAAVALPRYVNMQQDARMAKAQAVYGSIRAAASIAKLRCELDINASTSGACTSAGGQINTDGALVDMVNRYPAASATGIDVVAQILASDGITAAGGGAGGGVTRTFDIAGATTPGQCRISYTSAASVDSAPTITLNTTGC